MKVGIIGSAGVGQILAKAFYAEGHEVKLGTRDINKQGLESFKQENTDIKVVSFSDAAKFGELLVLAVSGEVVHNAVELAGKENFSNKTVIDVTNPIAKEPPVNGVLKFFTDINESLMEKIQQQIPDAKLVKAFNSVGGYVMYKPKFKDGTPTMFIAGNDAAAKQTVTDILTSFGWETEDAGNAAAARAIEPLCILWCISGFLKNDWYHAFKLLKA
ncbi:MAG: DNA-binding protein [Chitinophaga sp.]|jgi:8-hydroxy-5-deazaflavin:NADPH oxidoreductase|nr:DNA-binding protein [Chitinophaga sp.]